MHDGSAVWTGTQPRGVKRARGADVPDLVLEGRAEEAEPARRKVLQLRAVCDEHRVGLLQLARLLSRLGRTLAAVVLLLAEAGVVFERGEE